MKSSNVIPAASIKPLDLITVKVLRGNVEQDAEAIGSPFFEKLGVDDSELHGYRLLSNNDIDVVVDDSGVIGSVTVNDGDYNFSGVGLGDSFGDISKVSSLTDNGYTWDGSYGTVEMFSNKALR